MASTWKHRLGPLVALAAGFLLLALLSACEDKPPATPTAAPTGEAKQGAAQPQLAAPTPTPNRTVIQQAWQASAHNNKYDLGRGPNTYCARCHSPRNWDPLATVGKPPNCMSCKFPQDKEVRIAKENALIPEANWKVIGCDICHQVENGVVSAKIVMWNNATGKYDAVSSTTALCEKCHTDSLGGTRHKVRLGGGAHSNQIGSTKARPEACTDCHNPHSLKADCRSCHAKAFQAGTTISGHDAAHTKVSCVACHDASGMKVGPVEGTGIWTTGQVTSSGGQQSFSYMTSHDFKRAVDCTRCHYADNPWGLKSLAAASGRPS